MFVESSPRCSPGAAVCLFLFFCITITGFRDLGDQDKTNIELKRNIRLCIALFFNVRMWVRVCVCVHNRLCQLSSFLFCSLNFLDSPARQRGRMKQKYKTVGEAVQAHVCTHRVGSFPFPAVWVESFLLVCECFGLQGEHATLLTSHFLPPLTEEDADGSDGRRTHLLTHTPDYSYTTPTLTTMACTHLLSLPGYICVYSTLNFLANSMNAFIGRLHLVGVALLPPCVLSSWFLGGFCLVAWEWLGLCTSVGSKQGSHEFFFHWFLHLANWTVSVSK